MILNPAPQEQYGTVDYYVTRLRPYANWRADMNAVLIGCIDAAATWENAPATEVLQHVRNALEAADLIRAEADGQLLALAEQREDGES